MTISRSQMGSQLKGNRKKVVTKMKAGGKSESKVNAAGNYDNPEMRKRIFRKVKAEGNGGAPGQWSARKAQIVAKEYKAKGGGYTS